MPQISDINDPRLAEILASVKSQGAAVRAKTAVADARTIWAEAVIASPEGHARPIAAARLVEIARAGTMSSEQARSVLRGIRPEAAVEIAPAPPAPVLDAKAARLAEIQKLGVSMRADRGDEAAKKMLRAERAARRS